MNNQVEVFRTGESTRKPSGSFTGRVLAACAGLSMLAPLALAGGSRWGVSVGVASGGTFVGGSYSSGFYGGRGYCGPGWGGPGWGGRGWGGPGYCAPVPRPYCAPIAPLYCAPVVRPYYAGYRPYCPPVVAPCAPVYLPPVVVAPNTYLVDRPAVSVGVGVAGSGGGGYFSYSSAPIVTAAVAEPVYAAPVVQPVVYSAPSQVVTFVNPNPTTVIQTSAPVPQPAPQAPPIAQPVPQPPTVFQSTGSAGALDRAQSATSIISVVRAEHGDARANAAESFLGKTPAQAWPVTFEGVQDVGGAKEIRCRPIDSLSNGYKPTIIVRGAGDSNTPPRQSRGFVTGRVVAIGVDDPAYPGGLIVIDDGWVKW